jgi:hypothetical protein
MYDLAVMMTLPISTTIKDVDKMNKYNLPQLKGLKETTETVERQ